MASRRSFDQKQTNAFVRLDPDDKVHIFPIKRLSEIEVTKLDGKKEKIKDAEFLTKSLCGTSGSSLVALDPNKVTLGQCCAECLRICIAN